MLMTMKRAMTRIECHPWSVRMVAGEHSRIGRYSREGYIRYSRSRSGRVMKKKEERYLKGVINKENSFTTLPHNATAL